MTKMNKEKNLSKNQQIILDLIEKSREPVKAYTILSNVKKKGIKAGNWSNHAPPPEIAEKVFENKDIKKIEILL